MGKAWLTQVYSSYTECSFISPSSSGPHLQTHLQHDYIKRSLNQGFAYFSPPTCDGFLWFSIKDIKDQHLLVLLF